MLERLAINVQISSEPADFRLPRELHQARRVRHCEHVGIGRGQIEMCRKPGERGAVTLHLLDRHGRHQLRPQHPEEVDKANQEITYAAIGCLFHQVLRHQCLTFAVFMAILQDLTHTGGPVFNEFCPAPCAPADRFRRAHPAQAQ